MARPVTWGCLVLAASIVACEAPRPTAINPFTGERRSFASAVDVPEGWLLCASAETCPAPRECDRLDEASCVVRSDCSPTFASAGIFHRECDIDPSLPMCEGEVFAGCTGAALTCDESSCPAAVEDTSRLCPDGSVGGSTGRCVRDEGGACVWETRDCPPPPPDECTYEDCGPTLDLPFHECSDGSIGGNTGRCLRSDDGSCVWEQRQCPLDCEDVPACDLVCPPGSESPTLRNGCVDTCQCVPRPCTREECGRAPVEEIVRCADGTFGGSTGICYRRDDGVCLWESRQCPVVDCPTRAGCRGQEEIPEETCTDGSTGGGTGRCVESDGGCVWENRVCPSDDCLALQSCASECPSGTQHPVDADGCEQVCECAAIEKCAGVPVCRLSCPRGTHHPVDENGCTYTCVCTANDTARE